MPSYAGPPIDVAVLGATGSVGQRYADAADWRVSAAPPDAAANMVIKHHEQPVNSPIVFCSLPGGLAREVETRLASEGHYVFSNARDNRMDADVPLLIPEVNPDHAQAIKVQQRQRGYSQGFVV